MDRELKKVMQWLVIAALIIALANMLACTRVITVRTVTPYVPELLLQADDTVLGRMKCDLNGMPGKYLHPNLTDSQKLWVRMHEEVHVRQAERYGGCVLFVDRYQLDRAFRLKMEAEAYCVVFKVQPVPDPKYLDILAILINKYDGNWSDAEVKDAMNCKPP